MILSSSILSADFSILGEQIREAVNAGSEYVHFDVMDGAFVPSISFGMPVLKSVRKITDAVLDVHLMVNEPVRYIDEFAKLGADIITVHTEACSDVDAAIEAIKKAGCKVGLSVKPGTPTDVLFPYLDRVDMVLIMTVEPGFGGQKFIDYTMDKIKAVRNEITSRNLSVDVEIDGGVTADNISSIVSAGANVIVAGSAVFCGNISDNVHNLKNNTFI